jgi:hypothetical protein
MAWFKCGVCEEKDKRIADLKAMLTVQIQLLKEATRKEDSAYSQSVTMEANHALDGAGTEQLAPLPREEIAAIEDQAMRMLSGSY